METQDQIKAARAALRSAIFELTATKKLISENTGLFLLRVVEHSLRSETDPKPSIGIPNELYIEDEDNPITWRAYPSDDTTLAEIEAACAGLPLRAWVDLDCRLCLILRDPTDKAPPTAMQVAECMYGIGELAQWPPSELKRWLPPQLPTGDKS